MCCREILALKVRLGDPVQRFADDHSRCCDHTVCFISHPERVFSPVMQGAVGLRGDKVRGDSVSSRSGSSLMLLKQMISLLLDRGKLEPLEPR